jgi:hypothetical protein
VSGLISSDLPSARSGDLTASFDARKESGVTQLSTSNRALWDTKSSWVEDGRINLTSSFFTLEGSAVNWNSVGSLDYGNPEGILANEREFSFEIQNKNRYGRDFLLVNGTGQYIAKNWLDWYGSTSFFYFWVTVFLWLGLWSWRSPPCKHKPLMVLMVVLLAI